MRGAAARLLRGKYMRSAVAIQTGYRRHEAKAVVAAIVARKKAAARRQREQAKSYERSSGVNAVYNLRGNPGLDWNKYKRTSHKYTAEHHAPSKPHIGADSAPTCRRGRRRGRPPARRSRR